MVWYRKSRKTYEAELSIFKITNQDRNYKKKQIPRVNFIKDIKPYLHGTHADGNVDVGKYRIPDKYYKSQKEKDLHTIMSL